MSEKTVQARIVKAIREEYPEAWIFKVHGSPYQMTGVPDLLVLAHGILYGFEVKHRRPGESAEHARSRATPQQRAQIRAIRAAGGVALVVLGPDEVLQVMSGEVDQRTLNV